MKVWLIVVLALLGLVSGYGLPMRPAHALLALHWSREATQPIYENHAADCVRMFVGLCRYDTVAPVAATLAFDGPFLALSGERQPSSASRWLLRALGVISASLKTPAEIGQANGLSRPDPMPRQKPDLPAKRPKVGFCNSL